MNQTASVNHFVVITVTSMQSDRLYTRSFLQVFVAVTLFMAGVALQFHFGQYVAHIGYGVDVLGAMLAAGMAGTLMIRLHVGRWIDRRGMRPAWLIGSAITALAIGLMQFVHSPWLLTALRTVSQMAGAAVMTTVAVYAAQVAPEGRRAESIGTIGLGGFLGMILGPTAGDWIFSGSVDADLAYHLFFSASAALAVLSGVVISIVSLPPSRRSQSPCEVAEALTGWAQIKLIRAHWPGVVLLVGVVFAMVFSFQSSFLERLAEERGFGDIKVFFLVYGPTAILLRLVFRRVPQQIGRTRTLLGGLLLMSIGLLCMIGVKSQWQLVMPGLLLGAGHCFIFPSMVDLSAERLPPTHRATGTALILGAGDLGMLIGFGALGQIIDRFGFDQALAVLASVVFFSAALFAVCRRKAVFYVRSPG